jgi:hypothetical protein
VKLGVAVCGTNGVGLVVDVMEGDAVLEGGKGRVEEGEATTDGVREAVGVVVWRGTGLARSCRMPAQ